MQPPVNAPLAPMDARPVPIPSPLPAPKPGLDPMGPVTGENTAAQPVTIDAVMKLLRDDRMRGFRIDVETDQMVQPDEDAEKQRAVEFVTAVGQFLGEFGPMVVQMPPLAKLASNMLVFAVRRFKTGRELEDVVEQTMDQISQLLGNPAPQPMKPEDQAKVETAQIGLETAKIRGQAEIAKANFDVEQAREEHTRFLEKHAADMAAAQQKHDHEMERMRAEHQREMERHHAEMRSRSDADNLARDKHERDLEAAALNFDQAKKDREHQANLRERETAHKLTASERQHEQKLEQAESAHEQAMEAAARAEKARESEEG